MSSAPGGSPRREITPEIFARTIAREDRPRFAARDIRICAPATGVRDRCRPYMTSGWVRGALIVAVVVVAMGVSPPAAACSCGNFGESTASRCASSTRVFAGVVARYHRPSVLRLAIYRYGWPRALARHPVEVELAVDRVWKGAVPSRVFANTGMGGGDCAITPVPGTRFVVCDDEVGDAAPSFEFCSPPAFRTTELEAALGPSPTPPAASVFPAHHDVARTLSVLLPALVILGAALLGRLARRKDAAGEPGLRGTTLAFAVVGCSVTVVALRVAAHALENFALAAFGPLVLAVVLGVAIGFAGQRRPSLFRGAPAGLVLAFASAAFVAMLGYQRPHVGWDRPGAIECSRARAEAILASLPALDRASLDAALADAPYACTDWGFAHFYPSDMFGEVCLGFPDGEGGSWWTCRGRQGMYTDPELGTDIAW